MVKEVLRGAVVWLAVIGATVCVAFASVPGYWPGWTLYPAVAGLILAFAAAAKHSRSS